MIQQRFNEKSKRSWWGPIDPWLVDDLYLHPDFERLMKNYGGDSVGGIYPTVTIRQAMWFLRMKPIPKEFWECSFDRKPL